MLLDKEFTLDMRLQTDRPIEEPLIDQCVHKAQEGLRIVALGEDKIIEGWLMYGDALNEGRKLFPSNEQFGRWVCSSQLETNGRDDRAAAMWAAEDLERFSKAQDDYPNVRTVRGLHAKWKVKHNKPKPKPPMDDDDKRKIKKLHNLVSNESVDPNIKEAAKRKLDGYKTAHGESVVDTYIEKVSLWEAEEEDKPLVDVDKMAEQMVDIIFNPKFDIKWRKAQVQDWLEKAFDGDDDALVSEYNFIMESKNDH